MPHIRPKPTPWATINQKIFRLLIALLAGVIPISSAEAQEDDLATVKPPFVRYEVTWFEPPESLNLEGRDAAGFLEDVNKFGVAVGHYWFTNEIGEYRYQGVIADKSGTLQLVSKVFAEALRPYREWQSSYISEINANNQIAGLLFDSEETMDRLIVLFDLDDKSMTIVDRVTQRYGLIDMNEIGDMIVSLKESEGAESFYWLYSFPFTSPPQLLSRSENGEIPKALNGNRQVLIGSMIRDLNGEVITLGNQYATQLDEEGFAYADKTIPQRWTPAGGWQTIFSKSGSWIKDVSKDPSVTEVLIQAPVGMEGSLREFWIYRKGYGPYRVEVISGTEHSDDVERWNFLHESEGLWGTSVSRRDDRADAGYICGHLNANSTEDLFILSPIGDLPADGPVRAKLSIRRDDGGVILSWPDTVTPAALEISEDLLGWDAITDFDPEGTQHFFQFSGNQSPNYFRLRFQQ